MLRLHLYILCLTITQVFLQNNEKIQNHSVAAGNKLCYDNKKLKMSVAL